VSDHLNAAINRVASAILPQDVGAGKDATGGAVISLTEAVMGITAGLVRVADALLDVANAIRENHAA
jgi:hypothetical protein